MILATAAAAPVHAQAPGQNHTYQILVDSDQDETTGCPVTPMAGATLAGFEHRLRVTLTPTPGDAEIASVERQGCSGTSFGTGVAVTQPVVPPWPVGLDLGQSGADVIEFAVPLALIAAPEASSARLVFVAEDGGGSDVLASRNGADAGAAIVFGLRGNPVGVPVLSAGGLVLLVLVVAVLGVLAHKRLGRVGSGSLVLLATGLAWAMNFAPDGAIGDWDGVAPVGEDLIGDAVGGDDANDLVAGYAAIAGGVAYFRMDVVDVENMAPGAFDDAYSIAEDATLAIAAPGVLANDSDPESDPLSAALETGPSNAASFDLTADGSFDYEPEADFTGTDSFTYVASDGLSDSEPATVTITIDPVADPPTISAIDDQVINEDGTTDALAFTVGDIDTPVDSLDIVASSSNPTLLPNTDLTLAGAGMNRTITATPAADQNGSATITLTVTDAETPPVSTTFEVTVTAVNDAPVNTTPGSQTVLEDQVLNFSSANGNAISISDLDAGTGEIGTTLSVDAGSLQATAAGDATLIGNGTGTLTVDGTLADINATLDGVSYRGPADAGTSATLTITTNDQGNTGDGGPLTDTDTLSISVLPVNERPSIDLDGTTVVGPGDGGIEATASYSLVPDTNTDLAYAFGDLEGSTDCSGDPCFDDLWYEIRFVSAPETADDVEPFSLLSPFDRSGNIDVRAIELPDSANDDLGYIQWQSNLQLANEVLDNFRIRLNEPGQYVMEIIVLDNGRSGACPSGIEIPAPDPGLDPDGIRTTVGRNGDLVEEDPVRCIRESSVQVTFNVDATALEPGDRPALTFVRPSVP